MASNTNFCKKRKIYSTFIDKSVPADNERCNLFSALVEFGLLTKKLTIILQEYKRDTCGLGAMLFGTIDFGVISFYSLCIFILQKT